MSTMNRLANCDNPYQGKIKKVLCLCSAGLLRSPTAAQVINQEYGYNTRAAGISQDFALIPVDDVLLKWADEIVVMEEYMKKILKTDKHIQVLNIKDQYEYMHPELVKQIKERYEP